jgi:hypothetical protein
LTSPKALAIPRVVIASSASPLRWVALAPAAAI